MRQYRSLKKESKDLDKKLNKLYDRQEAIPEVMGKVTGSSPEFPYIETHPTIRMSEPEKNDTIKRLIRAKKNRKNMVDETAFEIEAFIASIEDSKVRRIFDQVFIEGRKQNEVAEEIGYSKGRITQIIRENLKD